jgi:hypothetical protein
MSYPEFIEIDGEEYEINTDYRYALACFNCINDNELSDVERAYGIIGIIYKEEPANAQEAIRLAIKYLQCGKESKRQHKPDMDFEYDESYIKSSFMSDYKIDLDDISMHWWKFCELLQGLTDNCVLNRVRDLRNYDLSTVKDSKTRNKIMEAQADIALPERLSHEEQNIIDEFEALFE